MITTTLYGRCGNQMFQIAALVGYALKYGQDYCIPKVTANMKVWEPYWSHLSHCPRPHLVEPIFLKETQHCYTPLPEPEEGHDVVMNGYWQSELYFKDYRGKILDLFHLGFGMMKGWISIHVRRGDYLLYPDKHPVITEEYLNEAISRYAKLSPRGGWNYLFVSDDPGWCREYARKNLKENFVHVTEGNDPVKDMNLASQCEHNIGSRSSFSWWIAWLNRNPGKIITVPKDWFGEANKHLDTRDLIPELWNKI